jgi:hypothetical protein
MDKRTEVSVASGCYGDEGADLIFFGRHFEGDVGDEGQGMIGNFRSVSPKSTKNVLRTILRALYSPASVGFDG